MHALETIVHLNNRTSRREGLWCKVADDEGGRWFAGEVISVRDDPAGNVTVKLRPDCLGHAGRLPQHRLESGSDWQFWLVLWLAGSGLLALLRVFFD